MRYRIVGVLALVLTLLAVVGQPAFAATDSAAARTAVSRILADYDGALFHLTKSSANCPNDGTGTNQGGDCWWWAANVFMALISYAEDHPSATSDGRIKADLSTTYGAVCGGGCPARGNATGTDPFVVNTHRNVYFDDIGWWEQAWINAYKWTHQKRYLYLAEQLWNYVTAHGWKSGCGGGVVQYVKGSGAVGTKDAFANALYLRSSAWLYSVTGASRYMSGRDGAGGAVREAAFIRGHLIYHYNGVTLGDSGAEFMMADHVKSCRPAGKQPWLQSQGEMVNAWTDMYAAEKALCSAQPSKCTVAPSYYNHLADELARTVIRDRLSAGDTWPFMHKPGQAEPTVDKNGILSEPCLSKQWPRGCQLINSGSYQPYLISKGIFELAIYCSNHNLEDSVLTGFASANAASIANLRHVGFLWDSSGANQPVIVATQASALDGLDTARRGSYAMC